MADAFRFEHKNSPEIVEPECQGGLELEDWKSSPDFPSHGDVSLLRSTLKDQTRTTAPRVTTEDYDDREIITSAEKKESQQKTASIKPKQDENLSNFLGAIEHEAAGLELIIVPPVGATSIPGSSSLKGARVTEIASGVSKEFHDSDESPESISRLSRIESAKQDMKNLKSATLGRMGKMFKIRPSTPAERERTSNQIEHGVEPAAITEQQYGQDPTRKEKTHSLGRMLRLVDKDGAPRKLFSHTRTGSLTRLRKLHSTVGNVAGSSDESRNIFSRMLSQFRGRNPGATNAEPNLQSTNGPENSPKPSLGTRLMMSLSARGNSADSTTAGTTVDETSLERVGVEYTA